MAEAKHSFVDDYPYLVYAPDVETTFDGNSGFQLLKRTLKLACCPLLLVNWLKCWQLALF